jgi:hypothetical protein
MTTLAGHRITLLFACRVPPDPADVRRGVLGLTLGTTAAANGALSWLDPSRLQAERSRPISDKAVWEWRAHDVSPDLHPTVAAILGCASEHAAPGAFALSPHGRNLVAGNYRSHPGGPSEHEHRRGLAVHLGTQTGALPAQARIRIENIAVFPFTSRSGIAAVDLVLPTDAGAPQSVETLLAVVRNLCNERRDPALAWVDQAASAKRFHLSDVLGGLLAGTGVEVVAEQRIYSHVTALLEGPCETRNLGERLARHYSLAYEPHAGAGGTFVYQPFAEVVHTMALEGASTIIHMPTAPDPEPEHLRNWPQTAFGPSYLPILLIAYHEHLVLLALAQESAITVDFNRMDDDATMNLRDLCHRYLAMSLRYRPSLVSRITMHNRLYESLRASLAEPLLAERVSSIVMEAERRLAAHQMDVLRGEQQTRVNDVSTEIRGLTRNIAGSTRSVARVQRKVEWLELIFLGVYSTELAKIVAEQVLPNGWRLLAISGTAFVFTGVAACFLRPWVVEDDDRAGHADLAKRDARADRADRNAGMAVGYAFLLMLAVAIALGVLIAVGVMPTI